MKFIDYFFYVTYRFSNSILKKDEGDSKWSAFLHTGVYVAVFLLIIICLSGIIFDNYFSILFKDNRLFGWMFVWIVSPLMLSLRYYQRKNVFDDIEKQFLLKDQTKRKVISMLVYTSMVLLPILLFILYRLYVFNQIKWW